MSQTSSIKGNFSSSELKALLQELVENTNRKIEINVNIDNIYLDINELQDLPFTLNFDKVNVKDNNGTINFGHNISNTINKNKKLPTENIEPSEEEEKSDIVIRVNGKEYDYYI